MDIQVRTKTGWRKSTSKKNRCSECGAKLWIAPHGGLYCNYLHSEKNDWRWLQNEKRRLYFIW